MLGNVNSPVCDDYYKSTWTCLVVPVQNILRSSTYPTFGGREISP